MSKRIVTLFCGFCIILLLLILRLGAISTDETLLSAAAGQSTYTLSFNQTRGQIYDCKLNSFTDTDEKTLIACIPTNENRDKLLNSKYLKNKADTEKLFVSGKPFLAELSGNVQFENTDLTDVSGIQPLTIPVRYSRDGISQPAPHILGYLNSSKSGVSGIEKAYDELLSEGSQASSISYAVDSLRRPLLGVAPTVSYAPILTNGVVLTLDNRIQEICEQVGGRLLNKGAIVVMEPSTGKLRAVASFPDYKLTWLSKAVADTENSPLINRAFCSYNVGSTFKIVTTAAALSQGITPPDDFICKGNIDVFGQVFNCHKRSGHGELDLEQAIAVSCNPYFIKLGLMLDNEKLRNMASDLSFGTAFELAPGMIPSNGVLTPQGDLASPAGVGNFSFGQGKLMATPIQISQMLSAVLNGGGTPKAQLVEGITHDGRLIDEKVEASPLVMAFSERVADEIKNYLITAVMDTPSQKAKPQYISAGGKTGTAQTGQLKEDGSELLQGWFTGFFPADNPKYVVTVISEDAISGNNDASPVFAEIADALGAPPRKKN